MIIYREDEIKIPNILRYNNRDERDFEKKVEKYVRDEFNGERY